jgi:membrane-associated phospholipid phosphatase
LAKTAEWAILAIALLIILSTVLIKQHLVIDLVGGVALAVVVWGVLSRVYRRAVFAEEEPLHALATMTRRLAPLYLFSAGCVIATGITRAMLAGSPGK